MNKLTYYCGQEFSNIVYLEALIAPAKMTESEYREYEQTRFKDLVKEWTEPYWSVIQSWFRLVEEEEFEE
jgi:hypothetical protein